MLIEDWKRQRARRVSTQHNLFTSTSTSTPPSSSSRTAAASKSAAADLLSSSLTAAASKPAAADLLSSTTSSPIKLPPDLVVVSIASDVQDASEPAVFNQHITDQIISGSGGAQHTSSQQVFTGCLALSDMRQQFPSVYEAKRNRCATSPSLFSHIAENEKHIILPSN